MGKFALALVAVAGLFLSGCGYNTIQTTDEQTKAAWSEVLNQYQRRADLIPNLVKTVQGYAAQEQTVLLGFAVVVHDRQIALSPLAVVGAIRVLAAETGQIVHSCGSMIA